MSDKKMRILFSERVETPYGAYILEPVLDESEAGRARFERGVRLLSEVAEAYLQRHGIEAEEREADLTE